MNECCLNNDKCDLSKSETVTDEVIAGKFHSLIIKTHLPSWVKATGNRMKLSDLSLNFIEFDIFEII